MSADPSPWGLAIADPQSWNLYSYVRNRPLNSVDVAGRWATELHQLMVRIALTGYVSAGELARLEERQKIMDSKENQVPEKSHMHAMRNGKTNESVGDAKAKIWGFVADRMAAASSSDGNFTTAQVDNLGDAIHTSEDYTSPEHTDRYGDPMPWSGWDTPADVAYRHGTGEVSPSNDWLRFGDAIRLTLAAFVQANPTRAAKLGLTNENYESEANRRISRYVAEYLFFSGISDPVQQEAARLCALGNPAACH